MSEKPETLTPRPFCSPILLQQTFNTRILLQLRDCHWESWTWSWLGRVSLITAVAYVFFGRNYLTRTFSDGWLNMAFFMIVRQDFVIQVELLQVILFLRPFSYNVSTTDATPWPPTSSTAATIDSKRCSIAETYYHTRFNTNGSTTQPQWALIPIGGYPISAGSHYTTSKDVWWHPILGDQLQHHGFTFILEHSTFDYFPTISRSHGASPTSSDVPWSYTGQTATTSTSTTTTWSFSSTFSTGSFPLYHIYGTSIPTTTQLSKTTLYAPSPSQEKTLLQILTTPSPTSAPLTIQRQTLPLIQPPFISSVDSTSTFGCSHSTSRRLTLMAWTRSTFSVCHSYSTWPCIFESPQCRLWNLPQGQGGSTPMSPSSRIRSTCGAGRAQHDRCGMVWERSPPPYLG